MMASPIFMDSIGRDLVDHLPFEDDLTAVLLVDPGQDLHQRGLACPVLADDPVDDAAGDLQGDPIKSLDAGKGLAHILDAEKGLRSTLHDHQRLLCTRRPRRRSAVAPARSLVERTVGNRETSRPGAGREVSSAQASTTQER